MVDDNLIQPRQYLPFHKKKTFPRLSVKRTKSPSTVKSGLDMADDKLISFEPFLDTYVTTTKSCIVIGSTVSVWKAKKLRFCNVGQFI